MSSGLSPISLSTASVCSPSVGGAVRTPPGVAESLMGTPSTAMSPAVGCARALDHATSGQLRVGQGLVDRPNGPTRHASGDQRAVHPARVSAASARRMEGFERVVVAHATRVGGEARRRTERLEPGDPAEALPTARRCRRQAPAGRRRSRTCRTARWTDAGCPCGPARCRGKDDPGLIGQQRRHRVEHRDVDVLSAAGLSVAPAAPAGRLARRTSR